MRRSPVSTIIARAARIADEHPRAASLAYRIRAEAEEIRAEPQPRPISAAPTDDPATLTKELESRRLVDVPPDPVEGYQPV